MKPKPPARRPLAASRPGLLRVTEQYLCFEGEGGSLGAPTWLLRLSGCDLRCWWCDSKQSSFREDEARERTPAAVERAALASGAAWLSVTGGEPLFRGQAELEALAGLCRRLRRRGLKVKVESNGLRGPGVLADCVDLWSLAPKWDARRRGAAALTEAMRYEPARLAAWVRACAPGSLQLKFVIHFAAAGPLPSDLARTASILRALPPAARRVPAFLVPQAYVAGDYLQRCRALEGAAQALLRGRLRGYDLRVQPQWHRVLYGDERGR